MENNVAAILLCICDILGAVTAYQASNAFKGEASTVLQVLFIIAILLTLIIIGTSHLHYKPENLLKKIVKVIDLHMTYTTRRWVSRLPIECSPPFPTQ